MAVIDLCKSRGRRAELEVCYGAGISGGWGPCNHLRISLSNPAEEVLLRCATSDNAIKTFGPKCTGGNFGGYRFHEFPKILQDEYDFAFDRNDEKYYCGICSTYYRKEYDCSHVVEWLYQDFLRKLKAKNLTK